MLAVHVCLTLYVPKLLYVTVMFMSMYLSVFTVKYYQYSWTIVSHYILSTFGVCTSCTNLPISACLYIS